MTDWLFHASSLCSRATLILGAPRSGTTWLHNILIQAGRFRGVPGNDLLGNNSRSPFLTDENDYVHRLLMLSDSGSRWQPLALAALDTLTLMIYARFGRRGELLLKSPYYCYFLPELSRIGLGHRFVFLRRSPDSVARSMLQHPHLSKLLHAPYSGFFEVITRTGNRETRHVEPSLAEWFRDHYGALTVYDRALFKVHCFSSAFNAFRPTLGKDSCFILDYDSVGSVAEHRRALSDFLRLSAEQRDKLHKQFRTPKPLTGVPEHNSGFRSRILDAEAAVWNSKA